ncbi:helix-turn-helix domain-containing protein [Lentisphaerota bacterium WC36G]|nr:helix-turn-helix domain-containing protein [Lentisphaerae bacterium WC36]
MSEKNKGEGSFHGFVDSNLFIFDDDQIIDNNESNTPKDSEADGGKADSQNAKTQKDSNSEETNSEDSVGELKSLDSQDDSCTENSSEVDDVGLQVVEDSLDVDSQKMASDALMFDVDEKIVKEQDLTKDLLDIKGDFHREEDAQVVFDDTVADDKQFSVEEIATIEFNDKKDEEQLAVILDKENSQSEDRISEKKKENYKMATYRKDQYSSLTGEVADKTIKLKQTAKTVEYNTIDNIDNLKNGDILRQAREKVNLDFKEVEEITKIKKSYIIALEEDDFSNMPPFVYTSAYVRTLCEVYRLAPEYAEKIIDSIKLDRSVQISERMDHNAESDGEQESLDSADKRIIVWFSLAGIAVLTIIVLGTMFIYNSLKSSKADSATVGTVASTAVIVNDSKPFERQKFDKLLPPVQLKEDELPMEK